MAIVSTTLQSRSCSINEKYEPSYTHVYLVRTDNKFQSLPSIRSAPGIAVGSQYPDDSLAGCNSIDSSPYGDDGYWHSVTVNWGPWPEKEENPLDEPPTEEWGAAQFDKQIEKDCFGVPFLNSAGVPPRDIQTMDDSRTVLVITRNEATFDPAVAQVYRDKLNRDVFFGAPPLTAKMKPITASRQFSPICGFYYQVKYEIEFNLESGWAVEFLNCGTHERTIDGKLVPILKNGVPVDEPVPLNLLGQELIAGANPEMLTYQVYHDIDFSPLNLE